MEEQLEASMLDPKEEWVPAMPLMLSSNVEFTHYLLIVVYELKPEIIHRNFEKSITLNHENENIY